MTEALIGYTGFVGGNLAAQHAFTHCYRSHTIHEIAGCSFDLIVCAGMPAEKWRANQEPEADRASLARLVDALGQTRAKRFILISTVDVYPHPVGVDEGTAINAAALHPYGLHRWELEQFVRENFRATMIVRLPALFGNGLRKNVIYDFLHNNQLERIHADAEFQFYSLDTLWRDLARAQAAELSLVNFATAPMTVSELARQAFGLRFENRPPISPPRYDVRCRHASMLGGQCGYLRSKDMVLADLRAFTERMLGR